ncbi:hypothetical protein T4D_1745 [Trichinella pseudospiralis]|uniref:Uncharacterized protein n=1 Tax=Trichinella pseudospiralis TaxID=6337 RepID=A0A0V1FVX4_TRIPS|nr:hypothetical protein T4D_1745 [Trichinella pseudospiralis]
MDGWMDGWMDGGGGGGWVGRGGEKERGNEMLAAWKDAVSDKSELDYHVQRYSIFVGTVNPAQRK